MDSQLFQQKIQAAGYEYCVGVPDSLLGGWLNVVDTVHMATQEGEALSLAIGYHLATGKKPLVFLQNSGLGNLINPLMSMAHPEVYDIPILFLIGWRGAPGFKDEPQHRTMGQATQGILEACRLAHTVVRDAEDLDRALEQPGMHAILIEPGTLSDDRKKKAGAGILRITYLQELLRAAPPDTALFATTGFTARELWALQHEKPSHACFYSVGGMGFASAIGLGFASFQKNRWTCVLDGDGAFLMHLGNVASIGAQKPPAFLHIVFRNNVHESTGSQPLAAVPASLASIARAAGYQRVESVDGLQAFANLLPELFASPGPIFLELNIPAGTLDGLPRPAGTPQDWLAQFRSMLA